MEQTLASRSQECNLFYREFLTLSAIAWSSRSLVHAAAARHWMEQTLASRSQECNLFYREFLTLSAIAWSSRSLVARRNVICFIQSLIAQFRSGFCLPISGQ
jgi:hypothetical protein